MGRKKKAEVEFLRPGDAATVPEKVHTLYIVHPKTPIHDIVERECRIVVTDNVTWAEPLMPLRGTARNQKRFMVGAFAFYTRKQAVRKKVMLLLQLSRLRDPRTMSLSGSARMQIAKYNETGEMK